MSVANDISRCTNENCTRKNKCERYIYRGNKFTPRFRFNEMNCDRFVPYPISLKDLTDKVGVDILSNSRDKEIITAKFAVYYHIQQQVNNHSIIARMFGRKPMSVRNGIIRFGELLEINDKLALKYWDKIKSL